MPSGSPGVWVAARKYAGSFATCSQIGSSRTPQSTALFFIAVTMSALGICATSVFLTLKFGTFFWISLDAVVHRDGALARPTTPTSGSRASFSLGFAGVVKASRRHHKPVCGMVVSPASGG